MDFYQPSEKISNDGVLLSTVLLSATAILGGIAYGLFSAVFPIAYLRIFMPILFGYAFAYGILIILKISRLRSKKLRLRITLIITGVMYYVHWAFFILAVFKNESNPDYYNENLSFLTMPFEMAQIIADLYTYGLWEIAGITIQGFPLIIFWVFELLILFAMPYWIVVNYPIAPYSEQLDKWYGCYDLYKDFESIYDIQAIQQDIVADTVAAVTNLPHGSARNFSQISIYYLEHETRQFLSIFNVKSSMNGKNVKKQEVVHLIAIDTEAAKTLIKKFYAKKRFFFDY